MNILIINAGSSSIKFQLIAMPAQRVVCSGRVERIGSDDAVLTYKTNVVDFKKEYAVKTHKEGFQKIADMLLHPKKGAIKSPDEIAAVGHRVVHGGDSFAKTTLITQAVKEEIKEFAALAPLHNPHNLEGILIAEQLFPRAKQVAVFDTAFHQTMPVKARKYAIPNEFYENHGIQVYGFHGTSHKYVSEKAIAYLKKDKSKIITIHLGNGCSMTAVADGKSVDHSLGFAPSNGLIMGSRSGDIDHSVIFHLVDSLGYTLEEVNTLLTKKSGMLGLTGFSDLRDIEAEAEKGNTSCQLALEMNAHRIKKYIGAYTAAMNGLDAIVFTAGIGENSSRMRKRVCADMDYLGLKLDDAKNESRSDSLMEINTGTSKVKILVIATDEELEIAKQAFDMVS
ncbi:acetate/propionate family kinase [Flagellimonas lutaonensis]|uniref:Acetate kinase n=1 Tax=Flagellimonas lutaonensis TaxID=516051 RepID=A0A0D5YPJ5_9FLAO|nr:acetate kinase [Allomuricauda lutaonensis]AKA34235.1 acetate kinase [Allomuricauda lutaonensis]